MSKVAVIGAGNVGATAAYCVAEQNLGDVVMVDVLPGFPQSKAIDFLHGSPLGRYHVDIVGVNDYQTIEGASVVIHTAGIPRKPGMDRMDLLRTNVNIAKEAAKNIAKYAPDAIIIAVANPLISLRPCVYGKVASPGKESSEWLEYWTLPGFGTS